MVDNFSLTPFVALREVLQALRGTIELTEVDASDLGVLGEVARWTVDYLCRTHEDLGRSGDVCPYTQVAMREGLLYSAVCHVFDADPRPSMNAVMMQTMKDFESRPPRMGAKAGLKAMLVLFPSLEGEWVDDVQLSLSQTFVERGLMIGEFHAECEKPGLHNQEFKPLRSPIPLLAVRNMMLTDLAFLKDSDAKLKCYLKRFGDAALNAIGGYLRSPHDVVTPEVANRLEAAVYGILVPDDDDEPTPK
ncbi:DUF6875 domain-containing protein [Paraliomyxa miuraensis]|uniref:DUF6875 domain-containing protein n=1 Tax=Paraliomyxa miuraensis TaxID=376150 RepID=UPI0022534FCC|nr:hypothetical protein [Paraliomyxa miuraensis]MCX4241504.1 hypothetical protein [Paraliomyxa miuraensis]